MKKIIILSAILLSTNLAFAEVTQVNEYNCVKVNGVVVQVYNIYKVTYDSASKTIDIIHDTSLAYRDGRLHTYKESVYGSYADYQTLLVRHKQAKSLVAQRRALEAKQTVAPIKAIKEIKKVEETSIEQPVQDIQVQQEPVQQTNSYNNVQQQTQVYKPTAVENVNSAVNTANSIINMVRGFSGY